MRTRNPSINRPARQSVGSVSPGAAGSRGLIFRDGVTTASPVRDLTFVGATLTDNDDGTALLTISGGSGGTGGVIDLSDATFGALGDATGVSDAVVTGGALSTVTSATAAFTAEDTGKRYTLSTTTGTITRGTLTYVSATSCTMSAAAGGAMTGARLIWFTDNTAAFNTAAAAATPGDRIILPPGRWGFYGAELTIPEGVYFGPYGQGPFFPDTAVWKNTWGTTLVFDHHATDPFILVSQGSGVGDFIMFDAGQVPPTASAPVARGAFIQVDEDPLPWASRQTRVSGWRIGSPYLCNPYIGLYLRGGNGLVDAPQIGGLYRSVIIDHNYDFISIRRLKVDRLAAISEAPGLGETGLNSYYVENAWALYVYRSDGFKVGEISTFGMYGGIAMLDSPDGAQDPNAFSCGYGMVGIADIDSCVVGIYATATNSPGLIVGEFQCGPNALGGTAGARAVWTDTGGSLAPLVVIGSWAVRGTWSVAVADEDAGVLIVPGTNPGTGAASAEGAVAIRYNFSTTTTDSDPGSGNLRLSNATQSSATVVRADLSDANGATVTTALDVIGDQVGTTKGYLRIQSAHDPRRWLLFDATALASPAGYRNITVSVRAGSPSGVSSPLVNGEPITLIFTPATVGISSGSVATDAIWDAKGDLAAGTGANTAAALTVGANDTILMADSGQATGLKWVASGTPVAIGTAADAGTADTFARGDHGHAHETAHVAHDTIFDAAGDLVVGSGADTAARLAIGAAGGAVSRINGVVAWNSGTSNPTGVTGDRYWRTDQNLEVVYDGTRWFCVCDHVLPLSISDALMPLSATAGGAFRSAMPYTGLYAIYILRISTTFEVAGGTALSASHKWAGVLSDEGGTIATVTIDSGASNAVRNDTQLLGSVRASSSKRLLMGWTKTGTPGSLYAQPQIYFRYIIA